MVARYRALGCSARAQYVGTFNGTFVDVRRSGRQVLGGFAAGTRISILASPRIRVCE